MLVIFFMMAMCSLSMYCVWIRNEAQCEEIRKDIRKVKDHVMVLEHRSLDGIKSNAQCCREASNQQVSRSLNLARRIEKVEKSIKQEKEM